MNYNYIHNQVIKNKFINNNINSCAKTTNLIFEENHQEKGLDKINNEQ